MQNAIFKLRACLAFTNLAQLRLLIGGQLAAIETVDEKSVSLKAKRRVSFIVRLFARSPLTVTTQPTLPPIVERPARPKPAKPAKQNLRFLTELSV